MTKAASDGCCIELFKWRATRPEPVTSLLSYIVVQDGSSLRMRTNVFPLVPIVWRSGRMSKELEQSLVIMLIKEHVGSERDALMLGPV